MGKKRRRQRKRKKGSDSKGATKSTAKKTEGESLVSMETLEGAKQKLSDVSDSLFNRHREATMIGATFLVCAVLFFVWQKTAYKNWEAQSLSEVSQKVLDNEDFESLSFEKKIEKLKSLHGKYEGNKTISLLLLRELATVYYQAGHSDDEKKVTTEEVVANLEKAREYFEELEDKASSKGIKEVARRALKNIDEEIEMIKNPPRPRTEGLLTLEKDKKDKKEKEKEKEKKEEKKKKKSS